MKLFLRVLALCAGLSCLSASAQQSKEEAMAGAKALLQRLFSADTSEAELLELVKEASKAGVPRQQIIEAKLIWGLRHQSSPFLIKILPEVEILASSFDAESAAALPNAEAVKSFAAYIKALKAGNAGDEAEFKKHILEAIWLNPQQSPVFVQTIEKVRRDMKMTNAVVDLKIPLTTSAGEATTLHDQLGGKKALLLDFWATFCAPCIQLMPALKKKSEVLSKHGVVVAGMNRDDDNAEAKAEKFRKEMNTTMPWLVEPADRPYTKAFDAEVMPRMVLLSAEGKVLFNGHPEDPELWTALKKIDPAIEPPEAN
ncbi:MAG TPA: TlpA disulfide reductase family protein [Prosthecobacter sp.]